MNTMQSERMTGTSVAEGSGAPSSPELRSVHEELETVKRDATELVHGLTQEQLAWRPAPDVWSIADNFAHLNLVNRDYYTASIWQAIADGRAGGMLGKGSARHGFLGNLFVRLTEPPVRFRVPSPRAFVPPLDAAPREVVELFMQTQDELQQLAAEANGLDLARVKVVSPINKHLKFTLGQAFRLLTAHERRHLWQAHGVKNAPNFPQ